MKMKKIIKVIVCERGTAILIVLALIAMLVAVGIMSVDRSTTDIELSYNQLHEDQSFYGAEAGIARAMVELNRNFSWRGPIVGEQLGGIKYAVIVLDSTWDSTLADTVIIRSTANREGAAVNLEVWIAPYYFQPFIYAAYGADSITMKNSTCIDSYNSDSGSYDSTVLLEGGDIGTNGYINLSQSTDVFGNATTTGGTITVDGTAIVHGDTSSSGDPMDFTLVDASDYAWAETNSLAPSGFTGSYFYDPTTDALTFNNYDTLVLSDGVYYFSSIDLAQNASLQIAPGANVEIYMTGDLAIGQYSDINSGGSAADVTIYSQGSTLSLGQHTELVAAFYGPNTNIFVDNNTNIYGSMIGASVNISNSACVHFDRSLLKLIQTEITRMDIVAWRQM
ncbi:MAG: hypothetical protein IH931_07350 [candidate division Zixibacteria bacterium]|nr:hypothetical protein [candidate division Zixibacteria bacterium]